MGFQDEILNLVSKIPEGKVITYKQLARALDKPGAYRAVGGALANNPRPGEIPCHRVVRSDGGVGGYVRGREEKEELLRKEGVRVKDGNIDLEKYLCENLNRSV